MPPIQTLLDVGRFEKADDKTLIQETLTANPEVLHGSTIPVEGTTHTTVALVGQPEGGLFRAFNNGVDPVRGDYETRVTNLFPIKREWWIDEDLLTVYPAASVQAHLQAEAIAILGGAWSTLAKQFYYGTDPLGFVGLNSLVGTLENPLVINAGGTAVEGGKVSSVYFVKWAPRDVTWCLGNLGDLRLSELEHAIVKGANDKDLDVMRRRLRAFLGLQIGSKNSVGRICNITEQSGKGLTDDRIDDMLSRFPTGWEPDAIYAPRFAVRQLKDSRTATTPTGVPAPWPEPVVSMSGKQIPIYVTDSISTSETVLA